MIPIVNLATPLFGTAFMVHMHKRLTRTRQAELLEPCARQPAMKPSTTRILTTHTGSLPRPPDLVALLNAQGAGRGL